jgi:hypothetical protein
MLPLQHADLRELCTRAAGEVGKLQGLRWWAAVGGEPGAEELARQLWQDAPPPPRLQPAPPVSGSTASGTSSGPSAIEPVAVPSGAEEEALGFEHGAVGGTFDRLHAGHRLLLAATALAASKSVYVGVTGARTGGPQAGGPGAGQLRGWRRLRAGLGGGMVLACPAPARRPTPAPARAAADALLAKKANKELLQPFEARAAAGVDFMRAVRPGLEVMVGTLSDPQASGGRAECPGMQLGCTSGGSPRATYAA